MFLSSLVRAYVSMLASDGDRCDFGIWIPIVLMGNIWQPGKWAPSRMTPEKTSLWDLEGRYEWNMQVEHASGTLCYIITISSVECCRFDTLWPWSEGSFCLIC